jgi:hypothetical protein
MLFLNQDDGLHVSKRKRLLFIFYYPTHQKKRKENSNKSNGAYEVSWPMASVQFVEDKIKRESLMIQNTWW